MAGPLVATDGHLARPSGTISNAVAARLLGIAPPTVQVWADAFGYPVPAHAADGGVRYAYSEVIALRDALTREFSIAAAVAAAIRVSSPEGRPAA